MIRPSDATRLTLYPRHIIKAGEDNMGLIASSDWHPLIISFLGSGLHGPPCSLRHDSLLGWWFLTEISWIGFPAVTTIRRKLRQKKTMRTGGKGITWYGEPFLGGDGMEEVNRRSGILKVISSSIDSLRFHLRMSITINPNISTNLLLELFLVMVVTSH